MDKKISRRAAIIKGLQVTVSGGVLLGLSACGTEQSNAKICADPNQMTSAQESVRRTLKYVEVSPDPSRVCSGCEFFHAPAEGTECGTCEMFNGEPVNPGGHCDSWSVDS